MKFVFDRVEGKFAVCFDDTNGQTQYDIQIESLKGLKEGDIFTADLDSRGNATNVVFLAEETDARRRAMQERLKNLYKRN